jgi:competence protein ComEA
MLCRVPFAAVVLICTGYALAQKSRSDASASREDAADKAAFQAVCGSCHPLTMVDGLRTESEWLQEIEQMVKIGAKGTDEQFERVVRVLLRTLTKVNVNTATAPEIAPVLDVTDTTAEALVKHRTEHGSFKTLEDLKKIPGVDAAKLNARKERIVF